MKYKKLSYCLIYNRELIKLETIKTYIQTNLNNNFIKYSKFL